ncbi:hypothetical protein C4K39_5230 [Pseudomonas sessilinigenes]|nr:hypothetical protein C4K39_5230 [Pseudomonas sessilinigenes]
MATECKTPKAILARQVNARLPVWRRGMFRYRLALELQRKTNQLPWRRLQLRTTPHPPARCRRSMGSLRARRNTPTMNGP